MPKITSQELIDKLGLEPHPEGGFFKQTYRSTQTAIVDGNEFSAGTSIYYLLRNFKEFADFSAWHRLTAHDESWHLLPGSNPITIYCIDQTGNLTANTLGDLDHLTYQYHVTKGTWFSAAVEGDDPDSFALVSCTVYPGFDFKYFELANKQDLISEFPQHEKIITRLTRDQPTDKIAVENITLPPEEMFKIIQEKILKSEASNSYLEKQKFSQFLRLLSDIIKSDTPDEIKRVQMKEFIETNQNQNALLNAPLEFAICEMISKSKEEAKKKTHSRSLSITY